MTAPTLLIDSHAHLDDARFDADRDVMLQRAWDAGVRKILTIGTKRQRRNRGEVPHETRGNGPCLGAPDDNVVQIIDRHVPAIRRKHSFMTLASWN